MRSKRAWAECVAGLSSTRSLTVLDLAVDGEGAWATRAGMFAIPTAAHAITQHWARAIMDALSDLDGVRDHSSFAADPCVALVTAAHSPMPMQPLVSLPLTHPGLGGGLWAFRLQHQPERLPTDRSTTSQTG
jgi:hypothetical protein